MPEVNTDKYLSAFYLRLEEVVQIEDFDDIEKEFLGKNSLLSEERKSLSSLNEVSRKKYGKLLQDLSNDITSKLEEEKTTFKSKFFIQKELDDNKDISIDWYKNLGSKNHVLTNVMNELLIFLQLLVIQLQLDLKQKHPGIILMH